MFEAERLFSPAKLHRGKNTLDVITRYVRQRPDGQ